MGEGSRVVAHGCGGADATRVRGGVSSVWCPSMPPRATACPLSACTSCLGSLSSIFPPTRKFFHPAQLNASSAPPL
jgi:hypothetical protein